MNLVGIYPWFEATVCYPVRPQPIAALARPLGALGLKGRAPSAGCGLWTTGITVPDLPSLGIEPRFPAMARRVTFLGWQAKISLFYGWLHTARRDVYRVVHGSRTLSHRSRNLEPHHPPR
jgi:hypothetical protein